jgi:RHS repeat-associated protein
MFNYRYNNRGRLDRLTIGTTVTADYTYDGLERLALRTTQNMTPAGTTHYVYDLSGRLIAEATNTGQTLREYIWLDDMPLAVVADVDTPSPKLWFAHPDHIDRPIKMTDGTQAVVWDAIYRPFGAVHSITGSASNNLRFPGQYFLIESGLHYNWHRHYDPTIGRYLQADPLEFVNGPSLFAYALSSPAIHTDPDGQFAPVLARIVVGGAAGYIVDVGLQYAFKGCVDWNAAFWRGALIGAGLGAPHWWWSSRAGGGGVRLWKDGPGIDWHRFGLNGRVVNRPHLEPGGKASKGHHWPWN